MTHRDQCAYALDSAAVRRVAELARLHVDDDEIKGLVHHFGAILEHFDALSEAREEGRLDLDAVDPFLFEDTEIPPPREDTPLRSEVGKDVLASAPRRMDSFFVVPRILDAHAREDATS